MTDSALSLTQFNARIRQAVAAEPLLQQQWVVAETSQVSLNRGHCYIDLVEKDPANGNTVAKLQAVAWASTYARLAPKFEYATGQRFAAGMKVMLLLSVNFHEQYGLKAVVSDINPEFTLGEMARLRREILERLAREGVLEMNRQLPLPDVPQRIAVISASTAAGYGDFIKQLHQNPHRLQFYTALFPAIMQGQNSADSVRAALDRVMEHEDAFDCVVIIRGGGAVDDLSGFENYDLAAAVAQFPLPVVVGIGHERDTTVLDFVAAQSVKTPTAAAQWLLTRGIDALARLNALSTALAANAREILGHAREQLTYFNTAIPATARRHIDTHRLRLQNLQQSIPQAARTRIHNDTQRLDRAVELIHAATRQAFARENIRLQNLADKIHLLEPQNTLNRGYALVTDTDGHHITNAETLHSGQQLTITLRQGQTNVTVNN